MTLMRTRIAVVTTVIGLWTLSISGQTTLIEADWTKIVVFQTKRTDVERILGKPNTDETHAVYLDPDFHVVVVYSDGPCSRPESSRGWYQLELDTVLEFWVNVKKPFPLSELKWKKEDFERIPSSHNLGLIFYDNSDLSVSITTIIVDGKEMVRRFWFRPTVEQRKRFRCKTNSEIPVEKHPSTNKDSGRCSCRQKGTS